jgi:hypothetical protein
MASRLLLSLLTVLLTVPVFAAKVKKSAEKAEPAPPSAAATTPLAPLEQPVITRFAGNPIIRPEMIPGQDQGAPAGWNIDFPSVIRVPSWLPNPLGKYYLYFSSHHGTYIRLAYADRLEGPWKIYAPGTLTLQEVYQVNGIKGSPRGHLAAPDVQVDDATRQIRLYFHSKGAVGHAESVALSSDGLHFKPAPGALGRPYFRVFQWQGNTYAIDRDASLLRSRDGLTGFEEISDALALAANEPRDKSNKQSRATDGGDDEGKPGKVRHTAVMLDGDRLTIFYTRTGDAPEAIMMTRIALNDDPKTWRAATPIRVMVPVMDYEGANLPITRSEGGTVIKTRAAIAGETGAAHALRDPFIFREEGQTYLFYAVAGERGIAGATLRDEKIPPGSAR